MSRARDKEHQKPSAEAMRAAEAIAEEARQMNLMVDVGKVATIIDREMVQERAGGPQIVCMCGSTRFKQTWIAENARLTGEGFIVLSVGSWGHCERIEPNTEQKKFLDALHLRKIDLCDWVWVLDVGGYCGDSTMVEIAYARSLGKPVRYLSADRPSYVEPQDPLQAQVAELREMLNSAMIELIEHSKEYHHRTPSEFLTRIEGIIARTAPKEGR